MPVESSEHIPSPMEVRSFTSYISYASLDLEKECKGKSESTPSQGQPRSSQPHISATRQRRVNPSLSDSLIICSNSYPLFLFG